MTLAEFQPYVEKAIAVVAKSTAKARILAGLEDERESIQDSIRWLEEHQVCSHCGERDCVHIENLVFQREPMEERLKQLAIDIENVRHLEDVPDDLVPELPLLSVPMDLITAAVARRVLRLPSEFPILRLKALPPAHEIEHAVGALAQRWRTANGQSGDEPQRIVDHV